MPREKSSRRERRSSTYSSESSYERKKSKSKHKRRSRSRDRSESTSHKRKRSISRSRHRRRSYSRSVSRERYESKSKRRSTSRSRSKRSNRRSLSRDRSHSRSRSRSRSKYSKSSRHKSHKRSRSSSSRSSSHDIERPVISKRVNLDDTESKVEKAIKAAEAAGLTMTKIPTYEYKEVEIKEEMPSIHDRNLIAELNNDSFVPKSFTSSRKDKKHQNIVIDLNTDTVKLPDVDLKVPSDDSILNFDALPSEEELQDMWIKKLYLYRKKMLKGEI